jgi:beta-lactamase class A
MYRRDAILILLAGFRFARILRERPRLDGTVYAPDFGAIERCASGRLGVSVHDSATSRRLAYRADERFPMCSTFKWLLVAHVLSQVDAGQEQLSRVVPYAAADLLDYAPVTRAHAHEGRMTLSELAAAAIQFSDNTAANLLLRVVGGPASFTAYLRRIGDMVSRLDRLEPDLNSALPGDARDTTTPAAMVANMERLLLGNELQAPSRELLIRWLVGSTTGADKLRAGFSPNWRIGDKTGMGAHGATNDVAIAWPPSRQPVLVAAYLTDTAASVEVRNNALAAVAREVSSWMSDPYSVRPPWAIGTPA